MAINCWERPEDFRSPSVCDYFTALFGALAAFGIAWQRQMHDLRVSIGATLMTDMSLTYESDVTARSEYGAP